MGKPTIADADLVLKLYELRTEELMRKARKYVAFDFWPETAAELMGMWTSFGSDGSAYLRQVMSYWEMASSFVNHEALNEDVFADSAGELFYLYAKYSPFIAEVREVNPGFLRNAEEYVNRSKENLERVDRLKNGAVKLAKTKAAGK